MKLKNLLFISSFLLALTTSCEKEEDLITNERSDNEIDNPTEPEVNPEVEVESFIYNGLNEIYLYKANVPELADNYFDSSNDKNEYLAAASSPEALFDDLIAPIDRFSFITDDYNELEERFDGYSGATGIKFGIGQISNTSNVFGFIRYVLPGTSASEAGLKRGDIFTEIDGENLTALNFNDLVNRDSFTINVGFVEDNTIVLTDKEVTLSDDPYTENPILVTETLEISGRTIGYLMYNSFIGNFDAEMNAAFAEFKSAGITDLVVDLRYNGGGSVESAKDLASMITGQFDGEVFIKEQWNEKYQRFYENQNPEALLNRFDNKIRTGETINSLNLSEVYILTSASSASASELIINGLEPYINVKHFGDQTVGKFQASVTLYDSADYGKEGANDNHTYALQPLVFKSINADGKSDYIDGLTPDMEYVENLNNLGELGNENEPLFQLAINDILGRSQINKMTIARLDFKQIGESDMNKPDFQRMYIDEIPVIK